MRYRIIIVKCFEMALNELALIYGIGVLEEAEINDQRPPRRFRDREDPFELSDRQFIRLFRLTKELAHTVIDLVRNHLPAPSRVSALDVQTKVLIALRFFASGSYQLDIGSNVSLAVSQSSVSRAVNEVSAALNSPNIFNEYVQFPRNINDLNIIRHEFYTRFGFPGVVGCLDCTHIAIVPPKINDALYPEAIYVNRKLYHSINVQLICDWRLKILNVNARYPGSVHDSFIWNNSNVRGLMENLHRNGRNDYYLLADSGYALRPWCLTPLEEDPEPGTPEESYNVCHKSTRSIIERCNGVLKMRFRCLLKHRVLHYAPNVASQIINSCVVLHNMCIEHNVPDPEPNEENNNDDFGIFINNPDGDHEVAIRRVNPDLAEARRVQRQLIRNYFTVH